MTFASISTGATDALAEAFSEHSPLRHRPRHSTHEKAQDYYGSSVLTFPCCPGAADAFAEEFPGSQPGKRRRRSHTNKEIVTPVLKEYYVYTQALRTHSQKRSQSTDRCGRWSSAPSPRQRGAAMGCWSCRLDPRRWRRRTTPASSCRRRRIWLPCVRARPSRGECLLKLSDFFISVILVCGDDSCCRRRIWLPCVLARPSRGESVQLTSGSNIFGRLNPPAAEVAALRARLAIQG